MAEKVSKYRLIFCLFCNLLFSVVIVLTNKWIYTHYGFPNLTLTCVHFFITTVALGICKRTNVFQPKSLPILELLPLSVAFCGFVVFTNLSLESNSVGTYQLAKTLTTPCIIFIQTYFYGKSFSHMVKLTLVPIITGVICNSYFDIHFTVFGLLFALVGVVVTSLYQIWVAEKQHEFQCNSMQLLYYQAPMSTSILFVIIPFFEPIFGDHALFSPWSYEAVIMVLLSGIVAFLTNVSIYWIIGHTSPLSYNMIGHLKFCVTIIAGHFLFNEELNHLQIFGTLLAFVGVICYSVVIFTSPKELPSKPHKS